MCWKIKIIEPPNLTNPHSLYAFLPLSLLWLCFWRPNNRVAGVPSVWMFTLKALKFNIGEPTHSRLDYKVSRNLSSYLPKSLLYSYVELTGWLIDWLIWFVFWHGTHHIHPRARTGKIWWILPRCSRFATLSIVLITEYVCIQYISASRPRTLREWEGEGERAGERERERERERFVKRIAISANRVLHWHIDHLGLV